MVAETVVTFLRDLLLCYPSLKLAGATDVWAVMRWAGVRALLCVSLVETFRAVDACAWVLDGSLADGLGIADATQLSVEEIVAILPPLPPPPR